MGGDVIDTGEPTEETNDTGDDMFVPPDAGESTVNAKLDGLFVASEGTGGEGAVKLTLRSERRGGLLAAATLLVSLNFNDTGAACCCWLDPNSCDPIVNDPHPAFNIDVIRPLVTDPV
jgi:hypothetical protein